MGLPTNLFVWAAALHSVSSMDGLDAPWTCLAARLENLQVQTMLMETVYIARGELAGH